MNLMQKDIKVLIIDDSSKDAELIKFYIDHCTDHGFKCNITICESSENALEIIQHNNIDIMFIDFMMPKMDGFEMLEFLKTYDTPSKIIFITGHHNHYIREDAISNGAEFYMNKNELSHSEFETVLKSVAR